MELGYIRAQRRVTAAFAAATLAACLGTSLSACSSGGSVNIANSQAGDPATVDFPIFYVRRTVPTDNTGKVIQDDLRLLRATVPSADLYMRATASASAAETNITQRITAGASWDVKDVDTSFDGTRVVFAMRGPLAANQNPRKPPCWRIYQYNIATNTLAPVINPTTDPDPPNVNDVSPHYLPDGRIVFSSTRQTQSQGVLLNQMDPQFQAQDEDRTEAAFVLEVMNPDGTGIHQISFNQSHDRDATVLASGRVLWSRWDNMPAAGRNQMSLYTANPDGTDLELYYGVNSHNSGIGPNGPDKSVVEFVQPREMEDGRIMAVMRQYTNVDFGGDLVIIDGVHYVENTPQPLLANATLTGPAQVAATPNAVVTIPGPSPGGRYSSAYPLHDGTGRILVSWGQCRLLDNTTTPPTIVACTQAALSVANPVVAPPLYSIWMFDPNAHTLLPIMTPVEGVMFTDVAVAQPRALPLIIPDKGGASLNQNWVNAGVGVLDIRSVYDFDGVDTANIPTISDPAKTSANARPARFLRLEKAVGIPDHQLDATLPNLSPAAFGASNYMIEIVGYAPIEPDGSVRIQVPAQVALRISVLDANARRTTPVQGVWLQAQLGEVVTCNGCHLPQAGAQAPLSHGRSGLFASAWPGAAVSGVPFPHTVAAPTGMLVPFIPQAGETMAQARMRVSCANDTPPCKQMVPSLNVIYQDVWTDPAQATPGTPIFYRYDDPTQFFTPHPASAGCITAWSSSCRTQINYPEHIQPLWDLARPNPPVAGVNNTCTQAGCHNPLNAAGTAQEPAGHLDLTNSADVNVPQQFTSYQQLLFTHNTTIMGVQQAFGPYLNAGSANMPLSNAFLSRFAIGSGSTHAGYMTPAELRLVSEWLDIGAQYFNNPFDPKAPVN